MKILTKFQEDFLSVFSETELKKSFFFTGGTALSAFYLRHRLSEDIDLFTEDEGAIIRVLPVMKKIASILKTKLEIKRNFRSFNEFFITRKTETLKIDFALDSPYRLGAKIFNKKYKLYVDNTIDISCNKLSALFDRGEPKDFVDVYFIDKEILPLEKLIKKAKKKHVGLDNYWLAVSMAKVENINILPNMLKPLNFEELKKFFKEKAVYLMAGK